MQKHSYGYIPDLPDDRDYIFRAVQKVEQLPPSVDMRQYCSPVRDQGALGSCTAFSMATGLREFMQIKSNPPPPSGCLDSLIPKSWLRKLFSSFTVLSPLFMYYHERLLEGTVNYDSGATMRDGMKVLADTGVCPEVDWPYIISKFKIEPPVITLQNAIPFKISVYSRITSLNDMKSALATGYGVVFGFNVYSSFETDEVANTGIMPMPKPNEQWLGGHAVFVVGYQDAPDWAGGGYLIIKNSWGNWGDQGFFYMPYAFASNPMEVSDIWTASV